VTTDELFARFPEIPADLRSETAIATFGELFDGYLQTASKPSACSDDWADDNRAYMKLIGPMDIYRYGLSTRERVIEQVDEMITAFGDSPGSFEDEMFERAGK
jgi:hypothetical protein